MLTAYRGTSLALFLPLLDEHVTEQRGQPEPPVASVLLFTVAWRRPGYRERSPVFHETSAAMTCGCASTWLLI